MHSSRMRTARLLPVSPGMHCSWGGCTWSGVQGVPGPGVCLVPGGVPGPWGCTWFWGSVPGSGQCTWSRGCTWLGDVPGPWGCTWSGGVPVLGGVPGPGGCAWSLGVPTQVLPPPVNRILDTRL